MIGRVRQWWRAIAGVSALVLACAAGGCAMGKATEPFRDAPRGAENVAPADLILMPDGFTNVASKCDGPNRVYVGFHGDSPYAAVAVVAGDPRCK